MAIENTGAVAPQNQKTFKDVYTGTAKVIAVEVLEPRFTKNMTEEEKANAFDIEIKVKPDRDDISELPIELSVSSRLLPKDITGRTEAQRTIDDLTKFGLISNGDISTVYNSIGSEVPVNVYDETSAKGTFRRCKFSYARPKIKGNDLARRLAAFGGSAKAHAQAPSVQDDDCPF